jgi:Ser/Thr protein kinase RdoA (MazF antagonist)
MNTAFDLNFILDSFDFDGHFDGFSVKNDGHINSTFVLSFADGKKYTLQKINTFVFKKPDELMKNIVSVTEFIKSRGNMQTLHFLPAKNGEYFVTDKNCECWRVYEFVDGVYTCNTIDNNRVFYNAGKAFGRFQNELADYPAEKLFETIPNFHNTYSRFLDFKASVQNDTANRADSVKNEIEFVLSRENDTKLLLGMVEKNELPLRVTHNDTKLNNVLFDNNTNEGVCIIDLDTVMPGLSLYDFGDSIRFGANTAAEDEKDLSKVSLSLDLYKAYTEGYLSACDSLTENEIAYLPFSAKLMTLECGMRFLTDYLNGDTYFKTDYKEHNLVRTRDQFKLVEDIEAKLDDMKKITAVACERK